MGKNMRMVLVILGVCTLLVAGFFIYDSHEPFVHPIFTHQIDSNCPYYKDFLGRIFYRYPYIADGGLFIGIPKSRGDDWLQVKNADNSNFRTVKALSPSALQSECLAYDGTNVIYKNQLFFGADWASFERIGESAYYKDNKYIYYQQGSRLPQADPATFKYLDTGTCPSTDDYAKDKNQVFYIDKVIAQADASSFRIECTANFQLIGRDKNFTYQYGKVKNL